MERYLNQREYHQKPPKKDIIINIATHGMFMESLLKEAGIIKTADGQQRSLDVSDFESNNFGGFIQPLESIYLDVNDPRNLPDLIPVVFERQGMEDKIFIDKEKLIDLDNKYLERSAKSE